MVPAANYLPWPARTISGQETGERIQSFIILEPEKIMSNTLYSIAYYGAHSVAGCFATYLIYLHTNGFLL